MLVLQYAKFVKPAFDDFVLPSKKYADVIIPRGGDNHVAIDLIVQHIRTKLGQHDLCKIYPNVYVIQSTFQVYMNMFCQKYFLLFIFSNSKYLQAPVAHPCFQPRQTGLPYFMKHFIDPSHYICHS